MLKSKKGFTLLETIGAISIVSVLIIGLIMFFGERTKRLNAQALSANMALLLEGIDKRLELEAYTTANWQKKTWVGTQSVINDLVAKELRTKNSKCGVSGGWSSEYLQSNIELIPCEYWNSSILPYDLQASASYTDNAAKKTDSSKPEIQFFNIDYYFTDVDSFKKNMKYLVLAKNNAEKFDDGRSLTLHTYTWLNRSNNTVISLEDCLKLKNGCALRTQIEIFTGISTDKVRIDGKNNVMGELDFDNSDNLCYKWTKSNNVWTSEKIKCTVQAGFNSGTDNKVISYTNSGQISDRISLAKTCSIYTNNKTTTQGNEETWKGSATSMPCGFVNDNSIISVASDVINTDQVLADNFVIGDLVTSTMNVQKNANMYSNLTAETLKANKSTKVNKDVTVSSKFTSSGIININSSASPTKTAASTATELDSTNSRVINNYTKDLSVAPAAANSVTNATLTVAGTTNLNGLMTPQMFINTRPKGYITTNGTNPSTEQGVINGDINSNSSTFYSGYTPTSTSDATTEKSWNTLTIQNLTSSNPKIVGVIGSTKDRQAFKKEMGNPSASDIQVDIYKDSHTFYSDASSLLKAKNLISEGDYFNTNNSVGNFNKSVDPNYGLQATNILAKSQIAIKNGGIYIQRNGQNRVVISNSGVVTLTGDYTGSRNSSADVIFSGAGSDQDNPYTEGFRNSRYWSYRVPIVNGVTRVYGDIYQQKPFHVNGIYTAPNIRNSDGKTLNYIWYTLNSIQGYLQSIETQYQQALNKLPPQKGQKGDTGEKGFKGPKGETGFKGEIGVQGPRGPMEYLKVN